MPEARHPLLVIDGDNFAHRSYHALPKSIRRTGNRGGGAIVGFANFLLRLYESERPRAVLVGWDTLPPRHTVRPCFPPIKAAAKSTTNWSSSWRFSRNSSQPAASPAPKNPGTRLTTSSPPPPRQKPGATDGHLSPPATVMRSNWRRRLSPSFTRLGLGRWRGSARPRSASAMGSSPRRCLILSRSEAIRRTSSQGTGHRSEKRCLPAPAIPNA